MQEILYHAAGLLRDMSVRHNNIFLTDDDHEYDVYIHYSLLKVTV